MRYTPSHPSVIFVGCWQLTAWCHTGRYGCTQSDGHNGCCDTELREGKRQSKLTARATASAEQEQWRTVATKAQHKSQLKKPQTGHRIKQAPISTNESGLLLSCTAKTGYLGVYTDGAGFRAELRRDGQLHYLGHYETAEEAAAAVAAKHTELQGLKFHKDSVPESQSDNTARNLAAGALELQQSVQEINSSAQSVRGLVQVYTCGCCNRRKTSTVDCTEGRVGMRCECGGPHKDGKPTKIAGGMHSSCILVGFGNTRSSGERSTFEQVNATRCKGVKAQVSFDRTRLDGTAQTCGKDWEQQLDGAIATDTPDRYLAD